ncbi:MAG: ParB/RepB/Spo0J family partition protein [Gemmatimonadetes bacterium]|nr:ParB/RepB/Spo0J family partition protein [Gemmatimonadota bacterium]
MADPGRRRLGKGLSALLGDAASAPTASAAGPPNIGVREVPVARCAPNPGQPRSRFDDEAGKGLLESIRARGVLQPILVTADAAGGYRIVAGERRWRAAQAAGLETIPALVKSLNDREMVEVALVENLQREDLNAMEEARGYRRLAAEFDLTQAEIAERVAKDRSTVANALRLLDLPPEVQGFVEERRLSMTHARALLGLPSAEDQVLLAREIVARGLSARQVEARVRRSRASAGRRLPPSQRGAVSRVRSLEENLQRALGTRIRITQRRKGGGTIEVAFHSSEEFERLNAMLLSAPD